MKGMKNTLIASQLHTSRSTAAVPLYKIELSDSKKFLIFIQEMKKVKDFLFNDCSFLTTVSCISLAIHRSVYWCWPFWLV